MSDFATSEGQVVPNVPAQANLTATNVEGSGIGLRNNFTTPMASPGLHATRPDEGQFEIEL